MCLLPSSSSFALCSGLDSPPHLTHSTDVYLLLLWDSIPFPEGRRFSCSPIWFFFLFSFIYFPLTFWVSCIFALQIRLFFFLPILASSPGERCVQDGFPYCSSSLATQSCGSKASLSLVLPCSALPYLPPHSNRDYMILNVP